MARKRKDDSTGLLIDPDAVVSVRGGEIVAVERAIPEDKLKPEIKTIADEAKAMVISNHQQLEAGGLFLKAVKALRKKVAEMCDPVCAAAHTAWKKTVALRESLDGPLKDAEDNVKGKTQRFLAEQEQLRLREEQRLNAIADKAAEEKADNEALLMEAIGDDEAAEAVRAAPVIVAPVILAPIAKPEGVTVAQNWKWKLVDEKLIPREYLMIDTVKLNQVVRAMKEATNVPGIKAYDAGSVRVG